METKDILEEQDKPKTVPYFVYEFEITRAELRYKRLLWVLILTIILLFASNGCWLLYESLYDTVSYSQDGEGVNNINTGEQGAIYGSEVASETEKK